MHESISGPGLNFYLFELQGSLKYTLTRNGKAPKVSEICSSDFEFGNETDGSDTEDMRNSTKGLMVSAVGLQLRLIKNDGVLKMEHESSDGAASEWIFDGMAMIDGGRMLAAAVTQTDVDPDKCLVCDQETRKQVEVKHQDTQTNTLLAQSVDIQTTGSTTTSIGAQTVDQREDLRHQLSNIKDAIGPFINTPAIRGLIRQYLEALDVQLRKSKKILDRSPLARSSLTILQAELNSSVRSSKGTPIKKQMLQPSLKEPQSMSTTAEEATIEHSAKSAGPHTENTTVTTTTPDLKRKASPTPSPLEPLNKRAKSTHDAQPWPRHIYMTCFRTTPIFKGDVGTLHIDVQEATAWFEGWYGKAHSRMHERKQIDLHDASTRVSYEPLIRRGTDKASHDLSIVRHNAKFDTVVLFNADCSAPAGTAWGVHTPSSLCPDSESRIPIPHPSTVVDALVHCIDVSSRREAVHDPDALHKLLEDVRRYEGLRDERCLSAREMLDWEFTIKELGRRERVRVVEEGDDEDVREMRLGSGGVRVDRGQMYLVG